MDFKTIAASERLVTPQCINSNNKSKYERFGRNEEAATTKQTEFNMINHIDKLYTRNYSMQNDELHREADCFIDIGDKFCKIVHLLSWHRKKHQQQQQQQHQQQHQQQQQHSQGTPTFLEYSNSLDHPHHHQHQHHHHRQTKQQILSCTESSSICTFSNNSSYNLKSTTKQLSFNSASALVRNQAAAATASSAATSSTECFINLRNSLNNLPYSTSIFLYINCIIRNLFYINKLNLKLLHLLLLVLLIVAFLPVKTNCIMLKKTVHTRSDLKNSKDLINNAQNNNSTKDSRHASNGVSKRLSPFGLKLDEAAAATYNVTKTQPFATIGAGGSSSYLDNFDNLERSLAAVLIKVAYGTTSTTKRSIPDNTYMPRLTTIPTPLLTTFRYQDKLSPQSRDNAHHRSYELDLEKDHALPTSAPNADILKSNSNTFYPNPNRHYNNKDRSRFRHIENSTTQPTLPNLLKKKGVLTPTVSVFPSYGSPPTRSFFTPPLPPEYQHPFADKPTLRGTNNDGIAIANTGIYVNRRPIPPPSLMPGHERIPFRPPELGVSADGRNITSNDMKSEAGAAANDNLDNGHSINTLPMSKQNGMSGSSRRNPLYDEFNSDANKNYSASSPEIFDNSKTAYNVNNKDLKKDAFPSIRRILSGSNGRRGEIPEVLLKQVTSRPSTSYKHPSSSSPEVFIDTTSAQNASSVAGNDRAAAEQAAAGGAYSSNINEFKNVASEEDFYGGGGGGGADAAKNKDQHRLQNVKLTSKMAGTGADTAAGKSITSTPSAAAAIGGDIITASVATTLKASPSNLSSTYNKNNGGSGTSKSSTLSTTYISWTVAWNVHIYLSVILFTILTVYSAYKIITYNKLSHLFPQSYFICIHLVLTLICLARIFYLCYDAYNIHSSFNIFVSDILLNLPATFLTIAFSVLILFVSIKSINKKNNRYSALIRPLTVIVGCSVHVILCITLHYVEFYTLRNHQHMYYHQQQQMLLRRQQINPHQQQQQQQLQQNGVMQHGSFFMSSTIPVEAVMAGMPQLMTPKQPPPPRVLSLICQVIYIFVCLSLGLLYLYLYRILKRILKIKSQNYIHGYQNLSYAIHITIATSLLFILLAILQIFGAVSISAAKPIVTQNPSDINWLKWGYQFSLRLIEIAIITLISWVSGLKTSGGGRNGNMSISLANGEARIANDHVDDSSVFSSAPKISAHDKGDRSQFQQSHHNVAGFFLPCTTSSSSQDQFETDCPTVCNANTNLHTYTMRTGKLIYHDSFGVGSPCGMPPQRKQNYHIQQATYERPYDTNSLHSTAHNTVSDYGGSHVEYHQPDKVSSDYNGYMRDDECHYETPKFDHPTVPRSCTVAGVGGGGSQRAKLAHKSSIPDSSATMTSLKMLQMQQQQHPQRKNVLQNDAFQCESLQDKYNVNMFERPMLPADNAQSSHYSHHVNYPKPTYFVDNMVDPKKYHTAAMTRNGIGIDYDDSERRSSNSTQSCSSKPPDSSGGGGGRYSSYNDIQYNGVRESDTFSNLGESNDVALLHNNTSSSTVSSASCSTKGGGGGGGGGVHIPGIKLPPFSEKQNHKERSMFCQ